MARQELIVAICLACGTTFPAIAHGQNLLVNGSFEDGPLPSDPQGIGEGSKAIRGWVVTKGSIDLVCNYWQTPNGFCTLDLDGLSAFGALEQTFATVPGQVYRVTFELAGNPDGCPEVKKLGIRAAGDSAEFTFNAIGRARSNMGWQRHEWQFTAIEEKTTLEFLSLDGDCGNYGPALDNVAVVAVLPVFLRGDASGDGILNIGDPVRILNSLFVGGTIPCLDSADVDNDGQVNISDAIGLLGYLFLGTLAPAAPFGNCGVDPDAKHIGCDSYPPCSAVK